MATAKAWMSSRNPSKSVKVCCEPFAAATEDGTDAESYGPLIDSISHLANRVLWSLSYSDPIGWCPWCGERLKAPDGKSWNNEVVV